jgi:hypothetical protein
MLLHNPKVHRYCTCDRKRTNTYEISEMADKQRAWANRAPLLNTLCYLCTQVWNPSGP